MNNFLNSWAKGVMAQGLTTNIADGTLLTVYHNCTCNHIYEYSCPIHWSNWSELRYKELAVCFPDCYEYMIARVDYPGIYDPVKMPLAFRKWTESLGRATRYSHFIWVNHMKGIDVHRHYLFGYPTQPKKELAKVQYRKIIEKPFKETNPMACFSNIVSHTEAQFYLRYYLGLEGKYKDYKLAPWMSGELCLPANVCDGNALYHYNKSVKRL